MLPVAPIMAIVFFVCIIVDLIMQSYFGLMPPSIASAQEKALIKVNEKKVCYFI